jgi:hypothetical protein
MNGLYALIPVDKLGYFLNADILLGETKHSEVEFPKQDATLEIVNLNDEQGVATRGPVINDSGKSEI